MRRPVMFDGEELDLFIQSIDYSEDHQTKRYIFTLIRGVYVVASGQVFNYEKEDMPKFVIGALYVSENYRKAGYGLLMQKLRESFVMDELSGSEVYLRARRFSWIYNWYLRRGYSYVKRDSNDNRYAWMNKNLNNNDYVKRR